MLNNDRLEKVDNLDYIGVRYNFNGKFTKLKKRLTDQARQTSFPYEKVQKTVFAH